MTIYRGPGHKAGPEKAQGHKGRPAHEQAPGVVLLTRVTTWVRELAPGRTDARDDGSGS